MKKILVILSLSISISCFSQKLRLNEKNQVIKTETTIVESQISTTEIDSQIKNYKQIIDQFTKKIKELENIRIEAEALELKAAKNSKNIKKN